ncbi:hypothetical protein BH09SUM1_BH09SUM1_31470 [soil metagenome]
MTDFSGATGTTGAIVLSGTDNAVLLRPTATFSSSGIVDGTLTIDGVSWDTGGPYCPINSTGQMDNAVTELSGDHRSLFSYQRSNSNPNTGSFMTYVQDTPNVGSFPVSNAAAIRNSVWYERQIGDGVVTKTLRYDNLFNSRQVIQIVEIDDTVAGTDMEFRYGTSPTRKNVPAFAAEVPAATAVINGNFFDINGTGETVQYLKINDVVIKNLDVGDGGVAIDASGNSTAIVRPGAGWSTATEPTIMATNVPLVTNKVTYNYPTSTAASDYNYYNVDRAPRTGFGRGPDGKLFMLLVDGRQSIAAGMTYTEFARTMIALGASNAVNMDGGGSSTMWDTDLPGNGVANLPSDGALRSVANAIMIKAAAPTAPIPALDARRAGGSLDASPHSPVNITLASGGTGTVTFSFVNFGTSTWTPATVFLGTSETFNHASALYNSADWISATRPTALNQASVAPGGTGTFTFIVQAPVVTAGQVMEESYSLVDGSGNFFGPWQNRLYVVVNGPATAGQIVVESRDAAGNTTTSPAYAETGSFGATSSKSTVSSPVGVTAPGARYNNGVGSTATFKPTITQTGNYNIYVTMGSGSNNNANASYVITNSGANVTGSVNLTNSDSSLVNKWLLLKSNVPFTAAGNNGITFTNVDGNNSVGARFVMDAVRFEGPVTSVGDWMIY